MKSLENICKNKNISFDAVENHCFCIAHIMNLAMQDILKQIKAGEADIEDIILNNVDQTITAEDVIPMMIFIIYY